MVDLWSTSEMLLEFEDSYHYVFSFCVFSFFYLQLDNPSSFRAHRCRAFCTSFEVLSLNSIPISSLLDYTEE